LPEVKVVADSAFCQLLHDMSYSAMSADLQGDHN